MRVILFHSYMKLPPLLVYRADEQRKEIAALKKTNDSLLLHQQTLEKKCADNETQLRE